MADLRKAVVSERLDRLRRMPLRRARVYDSSSGRPVQRCIQMGNGFMIPWELVTYVITRLVVMTGVQAIKRDMF